MVKDKRFTFGTHIDTDIETDDPSKNELYSGEEMTYHSL